MKKKWSLIAAAAAALALAGCMLAGCGSNDAAKDSANSDTTKLIVGFDQSYPPYGFVGNDGNYTGFDLDLATEVANRNGWDIQLEAIDWDAKDTLLNSGAINCIWNGFTMAWRAAKTTTPSLIRTCLNAQVVVVKSSSGIKSLDDLAGKNVITQTDSAAQEVLEGDKADLAAKFAQLETIGDYNTAFMQLESGAVDAVACDLSIAQYQMSAKPGVYTQLSDELSSEHYAVGVKKGNTELAQKITDTLKAMNEDGTVKQLCEKYADYGLSYENWILK